MNGPKVTDLRGHTRKRPEDHLAPGGSPRGPQEPPQDKSVAVTFIGNAEGPWAIVDAPTGTVLATGFGVNTYQAMLILVKLAAAAMSGLLPERVQQITEETAALVAAEMAKATGSE